MSVKVSIETVVNLNKEVDGFRDDLGILAVQGHAPHDVQLVQLTGWLHQLESLAWLFLLLLLLLSVRAIVIGELWSILACSVVAIGHGVAIRLWLLLRLELQYLLLSLVYTQEVLLQEVKSHN